MLVQNTLIQRVRFKHCPTFIARPDGVRVAIDNGINLDGR